MVSWITPRRWTIKQATHHQESSTAVNHLFTVHQQTYKMLNGMVDCTGQQYRYFTSLWTLYNLELFSASWLQGIHHGSVSCQMQNHANDLANRPIEGYEYIMMGNLH